LQTLGCELEKIWLVTRRIGNYYYFYY